MAISSVEYLVTTAGDLGAALKHYRTGAGITQEAAASAEGIGQPYLSALEAGKFGSSVTAAEGIFPPRPAVFIRTADGGRPGECVTAAANPAHRGVPGPRC